MWIGVGVRGEKVGELKDGCQKRPIMEHKRPTNTGIPGRGARMRGCVDGKREGMAVLMY
jgi:hypothetical protein